MLTIPAPVFWALLVLFICKDINVNENKPSSSSVGWGGKLLSVILILFGIYMLIGGGWLISLGGNWYYAISGILSILSGYFLFRGQARSVPFFALMFIGTLLWTIAEVGTDFWGWVPRFSLVLVLAIAYSTQLHKLLPSLSRKGSRAVSAVLVLGFVIGCVTAFLPHNVTEATGFPTVDGKDFHADTGNDPSSAPAHTDWSTYGGNLSSQRFSEASQITPENVSKLTVAWQAHTGDLPPGARWGTEHTPLKVGDFLYVCTAADNIVALDPTTGKQKWHFDAQINRDALPYTPACRSLAYYDATKQQGSTPAMAPTAHCARRIILGTLDDRVIEVDAETGTRCEEFGDNGEVSILKDFGETYIGYVSITSGPVVVRDTVVVGHQVIDGQRVFGPPGTIKAFDVRTGKLKWAWDAATPNDPAPRHGPDAYKRGSPNVWTTFTGDNKLGLVYLPVANPSGDYWSSSRSKEELEYGDSLVALDIETGMPRWTFQTTHHDVWDYDLGSPPTLVDYPQADGSRVPAIILPTKNAEVYVLNRETGKPLFDVVEKPAPQGGVEPEMRSPTQPYSTFNSMRKPDLTPASTWGLTPLDQLYCRIQFHQADYEGAYTPGSANKPFIEYPGYNGGSDWGGVSVDPVNGVLIANYNNTVNYTVLVPRKIADGMGVHPVDKVGYALDTHASPLTPQDGAPYALDINPGWQNGFTGMLCSEPGYGGIRAIDLRTGHTIWDRPLGTARKNGPFGIPTGLPINIGTPNNGGSAVTKGGLIFIAAATDDLIRAIDIKTGKTVWSAPLPAGGQANPMVYEQDGREYVVINATGHHFMGTGKGDYVIAYALPENL